MPELHSAQGIFNGRGWWTLWGDTLFIELLIQIAIRVVFGWSILAKSEYWQYVKGKVKGDDHTRDQKFIVETSLLCGFINYKFLSSMLHNLSIKIVLRSAIHHKIVSPLKSCKNSKFNSNCFKSSNYLNLQLAVFISSNINAKSIHQHTQNPSTVELP